jgi:hypothetical protein
MRSVGDIEALLGHWQEGIILGTFSDFFFWAVSILWRKKRRSVSYA